MSPQERAVSALVGFSDAETTALASLEEKSKSLGQERSFVQKEIKHKKQRDKRLMRKAAKDLTTDQLLGIASKKASALAKAKAKARATA